MDSMDRSATVALLLALGSALSSPGCASRSHPSRSADTARAPLTDRDPAPHQPLPSRGEDPSGVRALAVSSHVDSAVQLALEFVAAVRDADVTRIRSLVADEMFRLGERDFYRPTTAVAAVRTLNSAATRTSTGGAHPAPLSRLLQVQRAEVSAPRPSSPDMARGLLPSDTLVTFPVTPEGRAELARWYPGWSARVRILVRTSGVPRVIGF